VALRVRCQNAYRQDFRIIEIETRIAPLLSLRLISPRLELRLPSHDELVELAHLAEAGIHPPETMPFRVAWTDSAGKPGFVDEFLAYHEQQRETWLPEQWVLPLAVCADGELVGSQAIEAENFAVTRTVSTGSWLGQRFQGRGYGTEMRAAVLELAFAGLSAACARSGAIEGNAASERVSTKLGCEPAGEGVVSPRGAPLREREFVLTHERWSSRRTTPVVVQGLEPCLPLFGLGVKAE
jgi:RimJ/RimL family protein N-acetyltransferase